MANDLSTIFYLLISYLCILFCEMSEFFPFKNCVVRKKIVLFVFLLLSCKSSVYVVIHALYQIYVVNTFSVCSLPIYFFYSAFWWIDIFNFDEVQLLIFLMVYTFWILPKKSLLTQRSRRYSPSTSNSFIILGPCSISVG